MLRWKWIIQTRFFLYEARPLYLCVCRKKKTPTMRMLTNLIWFHLSIPAIRRSYWCWSPSTCTKSHTPASSYKLWHTYWRTRTPALIRCCTHFCRTIFGRHSARWVCGTILYLSGHFGPFDQQRVLLRHSGKSSGSQWNIIWCVWWNRRFKFYWSWNWNLC